MTECRQLLADYAKTRSEAVFSEIVTRYLNLVYSSALRLVDGDQHRAEDVSQIVFADLARKATELSPEILLGGWLHRHTCFVAANTMRAERRRRTREKEAVEMNLLHTDAKVDFARLAPLLDETINQLDEADRSAILLRFFEQKDFRAVGESLETSEDAARMRVNRALDKLREMLRHRGVHTTAGALAVVISVNAVQSAPVALAATISTAALASTAASTSALIAATKTIAMTTLQKTLIVGTIAALAGAGVYEARQAAQSRQDAQALRQQQQPLADQIKRLEHDRDETAREIALLRDENERLKGDTSDLLKLRAEVARLKNNSAELARSAPSSTPEKQETEDEAWVRRIRLLKQRVDQSAEAKIPELRFLTENDWMEAARGKLETEADFQKAFSDIRSRAQSQFMSKMGEALQKYLNASTNQFPTDIFALRPFFDEPPEDALLERYQIKPTDAEPLAGISQTNGWVITPKFQESGSYIALGPNGGTSHSADTPEMRILAPAIKAMLEAATEINGRRHADIHDLEKYLTTPEQIAAYQRLLQGRNSPTN